jgi:hypothetical protein
MKKNFYREPARTTARYAKKVRGVRVVCYGQLFEGPSVLFEYNEELKYTA